jgi:hypothetical protein
MSFVRPPREAYVRVSRPMESGATVEPGVELRDGDVFGEMAEQLYTMLVAHDLGPDVDDPRRIAAPIERAITTVWPGRAYFIEVHGVGGWLQIFQPFGVPRNG